MIKTGRTHIRRDIKGGQGNISCIKAVIRNKWPVEVYNALREY